MAERRRNWRAFWWGFWDGFTLGPFWRWVFRKKPPPKLPIALSRHLNDSRNTWSDGT